MDTCLKRYHLLSARLKRQPCTGCLFVFIVPPSQQRAGALLGVAARFGVMVTRRSGSTIAAPRAFFHVTFIFRDYLVQAREQAEKS